MSRINWIEACAVGFLVVGSGLTSAQATSYDPVASGDGHEPFERYPQPFDTATYLRHRADFIALLDRADSRYAKWLGVMPADQAMGRLEKMLKAEGYQVYRDVGPSGQMLDYGVVCAVNTKTKVKGCIIPEPAPLKPGGFSPSVPTEQEVAPNSCGGTYSPIEPAVAGRFETQTFSK